MLLGEPKAAEPDVRPPSQWGSRVKESLLSRNRRSSGLFSSTRAKERKRLQRARSFDVQPASSPPEPRIVCVLFVHFNTWTNSGYREKWKHDRQRYSKKRLHERGQKPTGWSGEYISMACISWIEWYFEVHTFLVPGPDLIFVYTHLRSCVVCVVPDKQTMPEVYSCCTGDRGVGRVWVEIEGVIVGFMQGIQWFLVTLLSLSEIAYTYNTPNWRGELWNEDVVLIRSLSLVRGN